MYWSMKIFLSFPIFVVNYSMYIFCLLRIRIMANPEVNNVVVASGSWQSIGIYASNQPTPVLLPGKSHGWRSVVGYSPWGHKELNTTE